MRSKIQDRLDLLKGMFANKRFATIAGGLFILLLGIYFIISGTFVLSLMQFNQTADGAIVAMQIVIAILAALQIAIMLNFGGRKRDMAGGIVASFASACPYCVPLWVYALGLGSSLAFLEDFSLGIGVIAAALLAYSLWRCLDPECR